ncbi:MAG: ester cyclase [Pseudonocardiaceae bacterium]
MSAGENKAIVERLIDAWNRGDLAGLTQLWSPDMVHHSRHGHLSAESTATQMSRFMKAFPDLHLEVHSLVAEDDLVATRLTAHGTHSGEYIGVRPTGRRVHCALMGQLRVVDGAVVDHWGVADGLHLLQQLGLVPDNFLAATA